MFIYDLHDLILRLQSLPSTPDLDLLNSYCDEGDLFATESPPMLTWSSSCSSFDGYLSASSIGVNAHQLQEQHQYQRQDTFKKPAPSQEMRAQVSTL